MLPWRQGGTDGDDQLTSAVPAGDGSVVLSGDTNGSFSGSNTGGFDFVAVKLDADGNVLWKWQVKSRAGVGASFVDFLRARCLFGPDA